MTTRNRRAYLRNAVVPEDRQVVSIEDMRRRNGGSPGAMRDAHAMADVLAHPAAGLMRSDTPNAEAEKPRFESVPQLLAEVRRILDAALKRELAADAAAYKTRRTPPKADDKDKGAQVAEEVKATTHRYGTPVYGRIEGWGLGSAAPPGGWLTEKAWIEAARRCYEFNEQFGRMPMEGQEFDHTIGLMPMTKAYEHYGIYLSHKDMMNLLAPIIRNIESFYKGQGQQA